MARALAALLLLLWSCSPPQDPRDAAPDGDAAPDAPDGLVLPCTGNGDDVLDSDEAPVALGLDVAFLVSAAGSEPAVDLAGVVEDGRRIWRFDAELPSDRTVTEAAVDPAGRWFESSFPEGTYAAPVAGYPGALGVYRRAPESIALLGIASSEGDETLITYDPPIDVARFPMREGSTWTVTTTGTGRVEHIAFNSVETVTVTVDAVGDVVVPAGTFPVLRVRTDLDRNAGPASDERVSHVMLAECWGRVLYVMSQSGETSPEFDVAEELWRLTYR